MYTIYISVWNCNQLRTRLTHSLTRSTLLHTHIYCGGCCARATDDHTNTLTHTNTNTNAHTGIDDTKHETRSTGGGATTRTQQTQHSSTTRDQHRATFRLRLKRLGPSARNSAHMEGRAPTHSEQRERVRDTYSAWLAINAHTHKNTYNIYLWSKPSRCGVRCTCSIVGYVHIHEANNNKSKQMRAVSGGARWRFEQVWGSIMPQSERHAGATYSRNE